MYEKKITGISPMCKPNNQREFFIHLPHIIVNRKENSAFYQSFSDTS